MTQQHFIRLDTCVRSARVSISRSVPAAISVLAYYYRARIYPVVIPVIASSCGSSTFPADASAAPVPSYVLASSPHVRSPTRGAATQIAAPATPAGCRRTSRY